MRQKNKVPFWMISAMCAVVAGTGAFVYSEFFWPHGTPPKIAGTWKIGCRTVSGGDKELRLASKEPLNYSVSPVKMIQKGEKIEFHVPNAPPDFVVSGVLRPPDNIQFVVKPPKEISSSGYSVAEGKLHIDGKHVSITGTYKTYHANNGSDYEQGVWGGTRVDTAENSSENAVITD